jgi:hypothetical protein
MPVICLSNCWYVTIFKNYFKVGQVWWLLARQRLGGSQFEASLEKKFTRRYVNQWLGVVA